MASELDRSITDDLEQLQGAAPEPDSVYKCPNLACQWRGTEPLNTQSNRGGRKHLEIRCPSCTTWIRGGFAPAGADIVLWPPAHQADRTLDTVELIEDGVVVASQDAEEAGESFSVEFEVEDAIVVDGPLPFGKET